MSRDGFLRKFLVVAELQIENETLREGKIRMKFKS